MIKSLYFYAIAAVVILSSCNSLTPFTQRLYDENGWEETELKSIQYYVSEDLTLERYLRDGETNISGGKILMKDGRRIERVVIPKGTPGILINMPTETRFGIAFEDGSDARFLRFGPNPKTGNQYVVLAKDWNRGKGKVIYDDKEYTLYTEDEPAKLLVDLRKRGDTDIDSRRAKGRTIEK